jgi:hypothetical protein
MFISDSGQKMCFSKDSAWLFLGAEGIENMSSRIPSDTTGRDNDVNCPAYFMYLWPGCKFSFPNWKISSPIYLWYVDRKNICDHCSKLFHFVLVLPLPVKGLREVTPRQQWSKFSDPESFSHYFLITPGWCLRLFFCVFISIFDWLWLGLTSIDHQILSWYGVDGAPYFYRSWIQIR